jgi:site-specific DNA-methyltransferase (cytosine-N4-specific)
MLINHCHQGDVRKILPTLVAAGVKVQCVVTSPPYWGLRDYGCPDQIGLEKSPEEYVANLVTVFGWVRELLADDGTLWLNLGDCYSSSKYERKRKRWPSPLKCSLAVPGISVSGLPAKNLVGLPWRVAFALQDDGWILRSEIIWHKPNPMPESIKDRPTKAHETIFLFAKSANYYYDHEAVKEPAVGDHPRQVDCGFQAPGQPPQNGLRKKSLAKYSFKRSASVRGEVLMPSAHNGSHRPDRQDRPYCEETRNLRDVWPIPVQPCQGAHFAVFPEVLAEICLKAGSRPGDLVMDPFMGSGTVAVTAEKLGRRWLGVELNPDYIRIQQERLAQVNPLLRAANL